MLFDASPAAIASSAATASASPIISAVMHCGYVSRSATVVRVFFVRLRMLSSAALPATAHTDRLSVPVISDALSERMSSASRTVRYGPATSASPSWVPSMEKESTTMSTVPSVSAEARMAGDSCLNTICFSAYPRVFATYLATSMSKPEYSPPCRYPSPGWSAATPIAIVGPCAAPSVTTETDVPHAPAPAASNAAHAAAATYRAFPIMDVT